MLWRTSFTLVFECPAYGVQRAKHALLFQGGTVAPHLDSRDMATFNDESGRSKRWQLVLCVYAESYGRGALVGNTAWRLIMLPGYNLQQLHLTHHLMLTCM